VHRARPRLLTTKQRIINARHGMSKKANASANRFGLKTYDAWTPPSFVKGIALIFPRRFIVSLAAAVLVFAHAAPAQQAPPAAPPASDAVQQLRQATQEVEAGRIESAVERLKTTAADEAAPPVVRYAANLMQHQLIGSFTARQSVWLNRQHVNAIVAAGNETAFVDALQAWTDERAFPVLPAEGAWYLHLFQRGYEPAAVYRMDAPDGPSKLSSERFAEIAAAHNQRLAAAERDAPMPGIVVIDPTHEHRLAGLALAIGRGQPILLLRLDEESRKTKSVEAVNQLNQVIMAAAAKAGVILADHWAGITLAGDFPVTYTDPEKKRPLAVDDLLGRDGSGIRLAVVGRLWGSRDAAIYQAMGSLFLQPDRALLFDDYSNRSGGGFNQYRMAGAAELLGEAMQVALVDGKQTTPDNLQKLTAATPAFDLMMLNTSGGAFHFDVRGKGGSDHLSMGRPRIYHMIHSFSAQKWDNIHSLAGRALIGGGYWYFGSVDEPYLHAFAQPTGMVAKYLAGTPLAFAARHQPGHPMYKPWKLILFGDPLLSYRDEPAKRVDAGLPDAAQRIEAATDLTVDGWPLSESMIGIPAEQRAIALADLTPMQFNVAAHVLYERGRYKPLVEGETTLPKEAAIARIVARQALTAHLSDVMAAGDLDAAADLLRRYLMTENNQANLRGKLNTWLAAMSKAGREAEATQWMEHLDQKSLTSNARKIIRQRLAPAEDEAE